MKVAVEIVNAFIDGDTGGNPAGVFLDSPYYKAPFYEHNLELADYRKMANVLSEIQIRFILSINDHPHIQEVFKSFRINSVSLKYTVSRRKETAVRELLVSNF